MRDRIGIIGLGTMGRNLALNIADKGFAVIGFDKDPHKITLLNQQGNSLAKAVSSLEEFVSSLDNPRIIIILVPAGPPVDAVIQELLPLLNRGDIIIDSGNSHFVDTDRRQQALQEKGLHLLGMGISGGEEGARFGPCLMPGGEQKAYEQVKPILEAIAAHVNHQPCIVYLGPGSAGHYVKMVHNGIEYGLMQVIAETYGILKRGLNLNNDELYQIFYHWNKGKLNSYLMEITAQIFLKRDDEGKQLIDLILDIAQEKGTGEWTSQSGMELHVPLLTIDMAVAMRYLSALKHRWKFNQNLKSKTSFLVFKGERDDFLRQLENALYMAFMIIYEQGMVLLRVASKAYHYHLKLENIARIWRGGCIIRSALLEKIMKAYQQHPDLNILMQDSEIDQELSNLEKDLRALICAATQSGLPAPAFMASLSYHEACQASWSPNNLIQAQRDCFGAHGYERVDEPGIFHTDWKPKVDDGCE